VSEASRRTVAGSALRDILNDGRIELQVCGDCKAVQYPPAEVCRSCLGGRLEFAAQPASGHIIASVLVYRSYRDDFAHGGPWPVASVRLDTGPTVFAHVADLLDAGTEVRLAALVDSLGEGVFGAVRDPGDTTVIQKRFNKST